MDGNTYTSSINTATHTLTNVAGCDSVVTLDLTILSSTTGLDTQVHCDTYTWIDGVTYTSSNNTATFTLTNAAGCDSVVTLDLTINNSNTGVDTQVHCDTYTWIDGNTYTSSNNTATITLTNAVGCDSVVTLDLTINNSNTGVDTQVHCDTYTWIDGNTYTSSNNTATHTLTNAAGCDSIVTLDLTINMTSITNLDFYICEGDSLILNGNTIYQAGVYIDTLINSNSCDSIINQNVYVLDNPITGEISGNDEPLINTSEFYNVVNTTSSTYLWGVDSNFGNLNNQGLSTIEIDWINPGSTSLWVVETDSNGCIGDTIFLPIKVEGSSSISQTYIDDLVVYPNPSNGHFTIQFSTNINQKIELNVFSPTGEIIFNERFYEFYPLKAH